MKNLTDAKLVTLIVRALDLVDKREQVARKKRQAKYIAEDKKRELEQKEKRARKKKALAKVKAMATSLGLKAEDLYEIAKSPGRFGLRHPRRG